jgi:hypothetical protein
MDLGESQPTLVELLGRPGRCPRAFLPQIGINSNMRNAYTIFANFQKANLFDVNLQGADLWRANCQGATFRRPTSSRPLS